MAKKRQRRYGGNVKANPQAQTKSPASDGVKTQQTPASGVVTYEDVKKKFRFYFNIVAKRKVWFILSALLVIVSVVSLAVQNMNYGMAFTGGTMVSVTFGNPTSQQAVSDAVSSVGITGPQVQMAENGKVIIRTNFLSEEERATMLEALQEQIGPYNSDLDEETVGPSIGGELQQSAITALLVASVLMLGYLAFRFKFNYAFSGIIALLHDVIITVGVFSLFQWQIDPPFIAAVLTVFGYSINDKVVIFDRIRENEGSQKKGGSYEDLVDQSIWQTMARSINTGLAVLLALFAIFILGGESTKTFSVAMIIGVVVGMYSSVFLASQLIVELKGFEKKRLDKKKTKTA